MKNGSFCSSSRKAKISTTGICEIFRGLKFEPDEEIGHKVLFCKGFVAIEAGKTAGLVVHPPSNFLMENTNHKYNRDQSTTQTASLIAASFRT